jgi:hypothetical protein
VKVVAVIITKAATTGSDDDYDVFDGDQDIGRIFRMNAHEELWFWGVPFQLIGR